MTDAEVRSRVINELAESVENKPKKLRNCRPCRLRMNGKFLVLRSGKTLWQREGDAKSALRNQLKDILYDYGWEQKKRVENELMKDLFASGILEIVFVK